VTVVEVLDRVLAAVGPEVGGRRAVAADELDLAGDGAAAPVRDSDNDHARLGQVERQAAEVSGADLPRERPA
jgi:hypothetical protein